MSKSKHAEAQIIAALSQADGNLDTSFVRRVSELIGGTLKGQADPSLCRNPRHSVLSGTITHVSKLWCLASRTHYIIRRWIGW
jgi:hypothetical protein